VPLAAEHYPIERTLDLQFAARNHKKVLELNLFTKCAESCTIVIQPNHEQNDKYESFKWTVPVPKPIEFTSRGVSYGRQV